MARVVPSPTRSQFGGQIIGNDYLTVVDVLEKIAVMIDLPVTGTLVDQLPLKVAEYIERNAETEYNLGLEAGRDAALTEDEDALLDHDVSRLPTDEDIAKFEASLREEPVKAKGRAKS